MTMAYIRKAYGVPAKRGMRIRFHGIGFTWEGRILGSYGHLLRVNQEGQPARWRTYLHPVWGVEYLDG